MESVDWLIGLLPDWRAEVWLSAAIATAVIAQVVVALRLFRVEKSLLELQHTVERRTTTVDIFAHVSQHNQAGLIRVMNNSSTGVLVTTLSFRAKNNDTEQETRHTLPDRWLIAPHSEIQVPDRLLFRNLFDPSMLPGSTAPFEVHAEIRFRAYGELRYLTHPSFVANVSRDSQGQYNVRFV